MIGRKVGGDGRLPSRVLLCGEGPGVQESVEGRAFCGASGAELDFLYLRRAAKLNRDDIYVTNIVKWRTDEKDSDPTTEDIKRDETELEAEILVCAPRIICAVGRIAAGWFLGEGSCDMGRYHGNPVWCPRYPDKILLVTHHPDAGLHQPERYIHQIYWDFEQLGRLVRGEIAPLSKFVPKTRQGSVHYSDGRLLAVDTEGSEACPWGMSWASTEFEGVVVPHGSISLRERAIEAHNILYDVKVLRALGQEIDLAGSDDSMLMAYLLPWLPRGLKPLGFKLCGIEQREYEDVIDEAESKIAKEYIQEVLAQRCNDCSGTGSTRVPYKRNSKKSRRRKFRSRQCDKCNGDGTLWPKPKAQLLFDKSPAGRVYKPRSVGRRLREILERGVGLREGWENIDGEVRNHIESKLGPMRQATLDDIPLQTAIEYSGTDAAMTKAVCNSLKPMLKAEGLWRVYEIDKGILPIIDRMYTVGIRIDRGHFRTLHSDFSKSQSDCARALSAAAGYTLNPASYTQVSKLLYDTLGLKPFRGEKSTDDKTLESLRIRHRDRPEVQQAIDLVTDYRELGKLLGTYVRPLSLAADSSDRIHTQFLLHVTNTGRLSSRDPNLQNIPTRTERGRLIRAGFIPRDGCRLVSVDLDQIELRVAAHMSEDENMIEVFKSGQDIHRATAALIYNKDQADVTVQERLLSKTINFLILYGGSSNRLHNELALLGIQTTKDQCVGYINDWFQAYPGVKDFMARCHAQAKQANYVECLFGRRRYVPGVHSCIDKIREESLRWATNFPIQATAAGILKLWMSGVWSRVLPAMARQGYVEPLLTIHDEIVLECTTELVKQLIELMVREAENIIELLVPLAAKGKSGTNWAKLK